MSSVGPGTPRTPRFGRRAFIGLGAGLAALVTAGVGWLARRDPQPSSAPSDAAATGSSEAAGATPSGGATASGVPTTSPSGQATATPDPVAPRPGPEPSAPGLEPGPSPSSAVAAEPKPAPEAESGPGSGLGEPTEPSPAAPAVVPDGAATPGVLAVGGAYLRKRPDEADTAVLMAALAADDGDPVAAAGRLVASDFALGRTVELDGWVLSVSEARAAAVVALVCPSEC